MAIDDRVWLGMYNACWRAVLTLQYSRGAHFCALLIRYDMIS
jgi:hypothetical protein